MMLTFKDPHLLLGQRFKEAGEEVDPLQLVPDLECQKPVNHRTPHASRVGLRRPAAEVHAHESRTNGLKGHQPHPGAWQCRQ